MRLLIVTDQYLPMVGGVPAVTGALARGLAARGHAVTVLAPSPDFRAGAETDDRACMRYVTSVPWPWYDGMRVPMLPARGLAEIMAAARPDVVHLLSPVVLGVLVSRLARRAGVPVVYTNHYLPANVTTAPARTSRLTEAAFYSWIVRFANRCRHVTAPSRTALSLLRERGLRVPSTVVSNGVDLRTFAPGPAEPGLRERYGLHADLPLVLSVGRLSGEKRVEVLLDACGRLAGKAQLAVAGTGPLRTALRDRTARGPMAGQVAFLGHVPAADLPALYRSADVFAISSEAELQSLATMEAMASGLPVVAADAYALGELVRHGQNGFLFQAGSDSELAAYLEMLIADPELRQRMGAEGLRLVAEHRLERTLEKWEDVYARTSRNIP